VFSHAEAVGAGPAAGLLTAVFPGEAVGWMHPAVMINRMIARERPTDLYTYHSGNFSISAFAAFGSIRNYKQSDLWHNRFQLSLDSIPR
jgi:hypothetical protein